MYESIDFSNLIGTEGFSDQLLNNHFTLYNGYVTNTNKLLELSKKLFDEDKTTTPEYAEIRRRFAWEYNGKVLHELYIGTNPSEDGRMVEIHFKTFVSPELANFLN